MDGRMDGRRDKETDRRMEGWWMVDDTEYQIHHAMFLEKKGFI